MSFDRLGDGEDVETSPARPLRAAPGLDRGGETGRRLELAEIGGRDRAVAELAAENADLYRHNADLYRRNAEQAKTIERLQARLDMAEARADRADGRFRAWAKEMANREDARAARDEARDKLVGELINRIHDLEHRDAERPRDDDMGGPERRVGSQKATSSERSRQEHRRPRVSNEFIGIGSAATVAVGTVVADPSPVSFIIGAAGIVGAGIPWLRTLRKANKDADRPRG